MSCWMKREGVVADVLDVLQRAGVEVVDADHPMPLGEQVIAEVRAEEPAPPVTMQVVIVGRGYRRRGRRAAPGIDRDVEPAAAEGPARAVERGERG